MKCTADVGPDRDLSAAAAGAAALAHPARLAILQKLLARPRCCGEVVSTFDLAQSTVSQHLKVLVEAGLVRCEADRGRSRYAADGEAIRRLLADVAALLEPAACRA